MFTEAPEIPAEARMLLARERAESVFPWTAATRTPSREAPVMMFRVIHARPNSAIPMSSRRRIGSTSANSTRPCPRTVFPAGLIDLALLPVGGASREWRDAFIP
jgi:hypothetical protein